MVINEIQFHPATGDPEFVELKNITSSPVQLYDPNVPTNTWKLNGLGYTFPLNTTIPPNGLLVLTAIDPATFRSKYSVPAAVPILGPFTGALQNGGETLSLQRPDVPELNTNTGKYFTPYIDVDIVTYSDKAPWPTGADGTGSSLERLHASQYGNDPINWRVSPGAPSPGTDNVGNRPPLVRGGTDQSLTVTNLPQTLALAGSASDDGAPNPPGTLTVTWSQVSGPATVNFANPAQPATTASFTALGTYVLRLRASDGELESSSDLTITLSQATVAITFVPKGSVWKYLDNGSDQGTAWRAPVFNDATWKAGSGELGYGDSVENRPEATVVGYGPDASNKYVTTYFRHAFSVTNATLVKDLTVSVMRDDGVVVYLNGTEVFRDNMPADLIDYKTYAISAIGGADEATYYSQTVDPRLLVEGSNLLAVEIHQANASSSDISFDLELAGDGVPASTPPVNKPPVVSAGANQTIVLPNGVTLAGTASDDGLPLPPAKLNVIWSKLSGPGAVTFSNAGATSSTATFSLPGTYVLRLTASDGALQTTSDVTIAVLPNTSETPRIASAATIGGASPAFRLTFLTAAGASYTVQFTDSLSNPSWTKLSDVPLQSTAQTVTVDDPTITKSPGRYYRIVTPQQ